MSGTIAIILAMSAYPDRVTLARSHYSCPEYVELAVLETGNVDAFVVIYVDTGYTFIVPASTVTMSTGHHRVTAGDTIRLKSLKITDAVGSTIDLLAGME